MIIINFLLAYFETRPCHSALQVFFPESENLFKFVPDYQPVGQHSHKAGWWLIVNDIGPKYTPLCRFDQVLVMLQGVRDEALFVNEIL